MKNIQIIQQNQNLTYVEDANTYEIPESDQQVNLTPFGSNKSNNGFINKSLTAPKEARTELFDFITDRYGIKETDFPKETWILLFHILNSSTYRQYKQNTDEGKIIYLIPIPQDVRNSELDCLNVHELYLIPLEEKGLIKIHEYNPEMNLCYRYEADQELRQKYIDLMVKSSQYEALNDYWFQYVYLGSGKRFKRNNQRQKTNLCVNRRKKSLKNIQAIVAKKIEGETYVNIQMAYEYLSSKEQKIHRGNCPENIEEELESINHDKINLTKLQKKAIRYEYQNLYDENGCLRTYKILVYNQTFDLKSELGRIYDLESAYINVSGDTKMRLRYCFYYEHSNDYLQWNLDAVACYPNIFKSLAQKYQIQDPLFEGKDIKEVREEIANYTKLPKATVKLCINAIIFGAQVLKPKEAKKQLQNEQLTALPEAIWKATKDEDQFLKAVQAIYDQLNKYSEFISEVRDQWILDRENSSRDNKFFINAVDRTLAKPDQPLSDYSRKELNKIQAFITQGIEGCFIQSLVKWQDDYNYQVTKIEHDGLTLVGTIPEEVIKKAREESGFTYGYLEYKENQFQEQHLEKTKDLR
jgi:hypothetical protein